MIKLLISVVVVIALAVGAWNLYQYWGNYSDEKAQAQKQAEAATAIDPHTLAGLPPKLEDSLTKATARGVAGYRDWLKAYRKNTEDPRLAWIELDYALLLAQTSPAEAKKVFAEVKTRLSPTSPVYPRVKQLERTFE